MLKKNVKIPFFIFLFAFYFFCSFKFLLIFSKKNQPEERISLKQIKSHEFFYGVDWKDVVEMKIPPPISLKLNISESDDCTTNNSSLAVSSLQNALHFEQMSKKYETNPDIQNEFEDLFPDIVPRSVDRLP